MERTADGAAPDKNASAELLAKLLAINRISVGTLRFQWRDHPHPLYFRCGTSDLSSFVQIFINKEYDVPLPAKPLGVLAGYTC